VEGENNMIYFLIPIGVWLVGKVILNYFEIKIQNEIIEAFRKKDKVQQDIIEILEEKNNFLR
jgi:hypothetical protein